MAAGGKIPGLDFLNILPKKIQDIGNAIEKNSESVDKWAKKLIEGNKKGKDGLKDVGDEAEKTEKKISKLQKTTSLLKNSWNKLGKASTALSLGISGLGLGFLIKSIQQVYELQERWARVTGMVNMRLGALTPNIKTLTRESRAWQGTVRGLTGDFSLGAQMFTEYASTLETTTSHVKEFSKFALVLARGFNIGGKGAGELIKTFRGLGFSSGDTIVAMGELTQQAEILGVNTQAIVSDLAESGNLISSFGKTAVKSLIQGSVFLKQFNIGLKQTKGFMDTFDKFDSAAEATARLNAIFGTTISSMDMLLTQDPAQRIEKIRQELLLQGKTAENISRFERKALSETLQLSEKEISFLLDSRKAHISLAEFREKAAKQQMSEQRAQKLMQVQLRKTAQTLFDFGGAMDRITVAVANMIKPLLVVLGLAKEGDKKFTSFGEVMKNITDNVVRWINSFAKSPTWKETMQDIADFVVKAGKWASSIKSSDITNYFERIVSTLKKVWKWSTLIAGVWLGSKVVGGIVSGVKGIAAVVGATKIVGGAVSQRVGESRVGQRASGVAGGFMRRIGPAAGPIGIAIGLVGPPLIKGIISLFKRGKQKSELERLQSRRIQIEKGFAAQTQKFAAIEAKLALERRIREHREALTDVFIHKMSKKNRKETIKLSKEQQVMIAKRLESLSKFTKTEKFAKNMLQKLSKNGELTSGQFMFLREKSDLYRAAVEKLESRTNSLNNQLMTRLKLEEGSAAEMEKIRRKSLEAELAEFNHSFGRVHKVVDGAKGRLIELETKLKMTPIWMESNIKVIKKQIKRQKEFISEQEKRLARRKTIEREIERSKIKELRLEADFQKKRHALVLQSELMKHEAFRVFRLSVEGKRFSTDLMALDAFILKEMSKGTGAIIPRQQLQTIRNLRKTKENGAISVKKPKTASVSSGRFGKLAQHSVGDNKIVHVAGDVFLDGQKVGRHFVREAMINTVA